MDASLAAVSKPLTALFIDCDSYFASVEQHLDPALRGRPVGVAPVMAESSCCIAASYEAKAFGVKTGTRISEARMLCPGITIVESKPAQYVRHHHRIIEAVEDCIHVEKVLSIDEMWAWLPLNLREPATVETIGRRIKETVARDVSPVIKVSIGAAPNRYLAKMASKMRKPDGLFIIEPHCHLLQVGVVLTRLAIQLARQQEPPLQPPSTHAAPPPNPARTELRPPTDTHAEPRAACGAGIDGAGSDLPAFSRIPDVPSLTASPSQMTKHNPSAKRSSAPTHVSANGTASATNKRRRGSPKSAPAPAGAD